MMPEAYPVSMAAHVLGHAHAQGEAIEWTVERIPGAAGAWQVRGERPSDESRPIFVTFGNGDKGDTESLAESLRAATPLAREPVALEPDLDILDDCGDVSPLRPFWRWVGRRLWP